MMKSLIFILLSLIITAYTDSFQHENFVIIIDTNESNRLYTETLVGETLNGLSLLKFRIGLFSTTGIAENITSFQSKQCLLGKLKASLTRSLPLKVVMRNALVDATSLFKENDFSILLITDQPYDDELLGVIETVTMNTKNKALYINALSDDATLDLNSNEISSNRKNRYFSNLNNPKVHLVESKNTNKMTSLIHNFESNLYKCDSKVPVRDECNCICDCINGRLTNCYRLRKEFSSMTLEERERFIGVYKRFSTDQQFHQLYLNYIKFHVNYFRKGLHKPNQFLPWHRRYLLNFESYLRLFDCRVTLPYWNWALHSEYAWTITPNYHMWRVTGGLGGNGTASKHFCVMNGKFRKTVWQTPRYENETKIFSHICKHNPHLWKTIICTPKYKDQKNCLRRYFNGKPPSYENFVNTISKNNVSNFKKFEDTMRTYWHNTMHNRVGGHMATFYASHAPEFWLHHAMLDCAWEKWQQKGKEYKYNFFKDKSSKLMAVEPIDFRYKYVQNDNLAGCGIKVTCENVTPKQL